MPARAVTSRCFCLVNTLSITFQLKVNFPKEMSLVALSPYRTSPSIPVQVDTVLDSYLLVELIKHSRSPLCSE